MLARLFGLAVRSPSIRWSLGLARVRETKFVREQATKAAKWRSLLEKHIDSSCPSVRPLNERLCRSAVQHESRRDQET